MVRLVPAFYRTQVISNETSGIALLGYFAEKASAGEGFVEWSWVGVGSLKIDQKLQIKACRKSISFFGI